MAAVLLSAGEYFLAELIESQDDNHKTIVAEVVPAQSFFTHIYLHSYLHLIYRRTCSYIYQTLLRVYTVWGLGWLATLLLDMFSL